ncbi:MAG: hypothetical protein WEB31_06430 [Chthoniobacterales bacterium]
MASSFNVYGYRFNIAGDAPDSLKALASDFEFFADPAPVATEPSAAIRIRYAAPDFSSLPPIRASVYTPRNISYKHGELTLVDYHGRGLGRHHRSSGDFEITTLDPDLQYEACYLFLLSQLGEALDRRGLHRVHALGISVRDRAVLVLLPMGGGKSTLGAELLADPEVRLLSDDSPLIDREGNIHAFPTRIGLLPGADAQIPPEFRRTVNRMNFGPKTLVDYRYFAPRVIAGAKPAFVCLGSRTLAEKGRLVPASRTAALRRFASDCVIGMGLFQGLEFFFQKSTGEILGRAPVAWSRLRASWAVLVRSQLLELQLGRDRSGNARLLLDYVRAH